MAMALAILLSVVLFAVSTSVHYATLCSVSSVLSRMPPRPHLGLTIAMMAIALAHVVEATLYAVGFWLGDTALGLGSFKSESELDWMDHFYFSLVNFTTLGRGDLTPTGHLRFMAGIEALQGFLLITASGSFLFQVMRGSVPLSRR